MQAIKSGSPEADAQDVALSCANDFINAVKAACNIKEFRMGAHNNDFLWKAFNQYAANGQRALPLLAQLDAQRIRSPKDFYVAFEQASLMLKVEPDLEIYLPAGMFQSDVVEFIQSQTGNFNDLKEALEPPPHRGLA